MKNYIDINGTRIDLTEEQVRQIADAYVQSQYLLADVPVGAWVPIGEYEMVVLQQLDGQTALILKDLYCEETEFAAHDNNYNGSDVDVACCEFGCKLAEIVGQDNIVLHEVDLTSDDGLKDYGKIERRASSLTAEMYRKFVEILDEYNLGKYWWLATPYSTERHGNSRWAKCVAPSGIIGDDRYDISYGVRPFCILKEHEQLQHSSCDRWRDLQNR